MENGTFSWILQIAFHFNIFHLLATSINFKIINSCYCSSDPPSTSVTTTQVIVNQTYPANLTCQSFGIPPPNLQWYSNTVPVVNTDSINVTIGAYINATGLLIVVSELNINITNRAKHEANYTCVAHNGIMNYISSRQNATTELLVQGTVAMTTNHIEFTSLSLFFSLTQ